MRIGEVIRSFRKKENLTQEQIASYLNISTPAVNKWENGISYPDIAMLAPLARILKIDVNTLLSYNEELTQLEVNQLGRDISDMVTKEGYDKAFERGSELIKQYANCDELVLRISSNLRLFLSVAPSEEKEKYERKIIAWMEQVASSDKEKTASMAKLSLSNIYREKNQYEKANQILDKIPEPELVIEKKVQQILLLESSGNYEEAYEICEDLLFAASLEAMAAISLIIDMLMKENKLIDAKEYTERAKDLVDAFDLGAYQRYNLDLSLAKETQDKETAVDMIIHMIKEAESMDNTKSNLYKHRKWNSGSSWSKEKYESLVKQRIKNDEALDFVKDDPRVRFLLE